ncbi:MAG: type II secretion system secretin GspD [Comamonadaceae bacterium]|nr:type II secretion system secretin GspD [Comamonadaceae bacterium]
MSLFLKLLLLGLLTASTGIHAQPTDAGTPQPAPESITTDPQIRMIRGNDQVLAPASTKGKISGTTSGLKFEEAPVADVVSLVLREIAKVEYVIHPPINGTITLATQGEVSADHAVYLLEAALQANGLQMARDTRGTYHIGRPDAIKGVVPAVRQVGTGPLPPGYGAVVIPLKYMGAGEMASILRPMAAPESIVRVDTLRNLLVMIGTRTQAEGWLDIVSTFDVDLLKGMSVGVFPLKHITTREVDLALRLLSGSTTAPSTAAPVAPGAAAAANRAQNAPAASASEVAPLATTSPLYGALRVIPIERINSVMIVTPRAAYLEEARRWIEKLDQPGGNSPEAQLFVYPVQNGNAKHLANVLNGLFGGGTGSAATTTTSGVAPSLPTATSTSSGFTGTSAAASSLQGGNSTIQGSGLTSLTLNTGLRVIADEINNAVLVYGTRGEFEKVQITLRRLDVPPTQVLIEASIIEVTLNDDLKYGLQWIFTDSARGSAGLAGTGVLSTAAGAVFGSTPAGFSYSLRNSAGDVRAVLNALADKSLVKVISSPSLMVLDNHTASIAVGTQQPVKIGQTTTSGGVISDNIQYKDTGVNLAVTPSVNAGNMVTMQLSQSVTDVGQIDVATGQRSFLQRQFSSKVAVRSGEALVLGGLIRDNSTTGKSGLPGLQDIPLFGSLFGATNSSVNRTELLVIITPRVVRTEQDVRQLGQELKDRMKGLYPAGSGMPADPAAGNNR